MVVSLAGVNRAILSPLMSCAKFPQFGERVGIREISNSVYREERRILFLDSDFTLLLKKGCERKFGSGNLERYGFPCGVNVILLLFGRRACFRRLLRNQ
jgi:hypothetical protein